MATLVLEYFLSSLLLACFKQKFAFSVLYTDTLKIPVYGSIDRERAMTLKVLICTTTRPINYNTTSRLYYKFSKEYFYKCGTANRILTENTAIKLR